ncbi:MAG: NAD(P)H-dependent oxidoreductase subunit E [Bacteroidales bacterium]
MGGKTEIMICLGSSCFARGNKATLNAIVDYIGKHKLTDKVYFHGAHCFGQCAEGPIVKINNSVYTGVNEYNIIDILTNELSND